MKKIFHKNSKSAAFTLAEVLITLSILGVVAAIMIPSTMQKVTDKQTITAVKRAYSMFDNAFQMMNVIEGKPYTWQFPNPDAQDDAENTTYFAKKLSGYLNVRKFCGAARGCISYGHTCNGVHQCYKTLSDGSTGAQNYTEATNNGKFVLQNGMTVNINLSKLQKRIDEIEQYQTDKNHTPMGSIRVDINGSNGPNRNGYDVFYFWYNNDGLMSLDNDKITFYQASYCDKSATELPYAGRSCAKWIIKHNNMDYKYRDVSAEW